MKCSHFSIAVVFCITRYLSMSTFCFAAGDPMDWWKLDEGSGIIAANTVSDADGTLINGPTWTSGVSNGALLFDGIDDFVEVNDYAGIIGTAARTDRKSVV